MDMKMEMKAHCPSEVGRLVDSSQATDRKFIALVRERRLLYARNNMPVASFYQQVKQLWEEVAHHMNWSVPMARRKWSHIRNSYSRHLRNEVHGARTGRGRIVSRWYLADELEFLREHMATDTRPAPYAPYAPAAFLELEVGEAADPADAADAADARASPSPPDVKPFAHSAWFATALSSPHAPLQPLRTPPAAPPPLDDTCSSDAFAPEESSSYFHFFRGLHDDYQELSPKRQRQFRRHCLALLHRLLDEEDAAPLDQLHSLDEPESILPVD